MLKQAKSVLSLTLIIAFISTSVYTPQAYAGNVVIPLMPTPGTMVQFSRAFVPAHLQGIVIHPDNALQFDFLIQKGGSDLSEAQKKEEYNKLIKYFLASLTVPDENQWVNLSPYESNRIIQDDFGKTEMGRDLLAQDYLLKQITSSLMYPESGLGKEFWNKIYEKVNSELGNVNIPVNTFNKVWIVPSEAVVHENGNTAFIVKSHLKVMLEEDYLATKTNTKSPVETRFIASQTTNRTTKNAIRDIILPALEKEVNSGKNFAQLRQVFSGMILATWYKQALKESLLGKVYADKAKVNGVTQHDPKTNEVIYQQYLQAFKKGVYNYIKEEKDQLTNKPIPRKYFAGGVGAHDATLVSRAMVSDQAMLRNIQPVARSLDSARTDLNPDNKSGKFMANPAMSVVGRVVAVVQAAYRERAQENLPKINVKATTKSKGDNDVDLNNMMRGTIKSGDTFTLRLVQRGNEKLWKLRVGQAFRKPDFIQAMIQAKKIVSENPATNFDVEGKFNGVLRVSDPNETFIPLLVRNTAELIAVQDNVPVLSSKEIRNIVDNLEVEDQLLNSNQAMTGADQKGLHPEIINLRGSRPGMRSFMNQMRLKKVAGLDNVIAALSRINPNIIDFMQDLNNSISLRDVESVKKEITAAGYDINKISVSFFTFDGQTIVAWIYHDDAMAAVANTLHNSSIWFSLTNVTVNAFQFFGKMAAANQEIVNFPKEYLSELTMSFKPYSDGPESYNLQLIHETPTSNFFIIDPQSKHSIELKEGEAITLGRHPKNRHGFLGLAGPRISSAHVTILVENDHVTITDGGDVGSSIGTSFSWKKFDGFTKDLTGNSDDVGDTHATINLNDVADNQFILVVNESNLSFEKIEYSKALNRLQIIGSGEFIYPSEEHEIGDGIQAKLTVIEGTPYLSIRKVNGNDKIEVRYTPRPDYMEITRMTKNSDQEAIRKEMVDQIIRFAMLNQLTAAEMGKYIFETEKVKGDEYWERDLEVALKDKFPEFKGASFRYDISKLLTEAYIRYRILEESVVPSNSLVLPSSLDLDLNIPTTDAAMTPTGGIDMNAANMAMVIKRDGKGVPLPLAQQDLAQLAQIDGFVPRIIEIRPLVNMPMFKNLGIK